MKKFSLLLAAVIVFGFTNGGKEISEKEKSALLTNPKSDVYLQGFYWNSPPGGIWWDSLASLAPALASAGFSGIWVPSPAKGAGGSFSMGYDPYDHYDFGDYFQKGTRETRFGSREELENMIQAFKEVGISVFADAVMNHMNGGEKESMLDCYPAGYDPDSTRYFVFDYPNGSGRFQKDSTFFYPNSEFCDENPPYHGADDPIFQFGEWLAHDRDFVRDSLIVWGNYLTEELGFEGFRIDAVKGIDPAFAGAWLSAVANPNNYYAVAEYYGGTSDIDYWHNQTQNVHGGNVSMFDFPLRFALSDMCNNTSGAYDINNLYGAGLVNAGFSGFDVSTFVENHDLDRIGYDGSGDDDPGHHPIIYDKDLAYAYTIFSEGRPSVFFKDYFMYGFKGKIDTLIWIRQNFLGGGTTKGPDLNPWFIVEESNYSSDLYVARRNGDDTNPEVYLLINDHPTQWKGVWVNTSHANETFKDYTGQAENQPAQADGRTQFWAPPRGYTVFIPDLDGSINNPPVLNKVPDQLAYTMSQFSYQLEFNDANNDNLEFNLSGNPDWLSVDSEGMLAGVPGMDDVESSQVVITVSDPSSESVSDTFIVNVELNYGPTVEDIPDGSVKATERFTYQSIATDPDEDQISYKLLQSPGWLNVGGETGLLSGTPAIEDTGFYYVLLQVTDGKGAFDSTDFNLEVYENLDTLIATFGKPTIDGTVNLSPDDWLEDWLLAADDSEDGAWNPGSPVDNELFNVYATWDADSIYLGIDYILNDDYNTLMIYIEAGLDGGVTDFNSNRGYNGDYAKNFLFTSENAIDFFAADYFTAAPTFFAIDSNQSVNITDLINGKRGAAGKDMEMAVAWNDIYGLGAGIIPANVKLKLVALIAGGLNYGAGDSAPDNPDVDGDAGPDSLINLAALSPDEDGDGYPDPTIFISDVKKVTEDITPTVYRLEQNYPNPFNPSTVIGFQLPASGNVQLKIFDILGREITTLVKKEMKPGNYTVEFNASHLSSGVYFYQLKTDQFVDIKKMLLVK
ncbi:MAG: DUF1939 domain-containing protein [Melioribacteraceae bacterium]|nr:DUF1939 domain-containing protein [Melioribacteraceae bacterium]MCF8356728.1 DUF1939 domain-containing protein [Melioribacteraceae bacterium]MCF8396082.1 DUF1939 domain-containing protein [Melioribacteraceae bacterium]MCF8421068.1 DUF1939 domain-containing protein [Melioribacteraceae bacterium]